MPLGNCVFCSLTSEFLVLDSVYPLLEEKIVVSSARVRGDLRGLLMQLFSRYSKRSLRISMSGVPPITKGGYAGP